MAGASPESFHSISIAPPPFNVAPGLGVMNSTSAWTSAKRVRAAATVLTSTMMIGVSDVKDSICEGEAN